MTHVTHIGDRHHATASTHMQSPEPLQITIIADEATCKARRE
jgi:hypothetical protein